MVTPDISVVGLGQCHYLIAMDATAVPIPVVFHAAAALLVLVLGPINIIRRKRDRFHRRLGRTWVVLMYVTCVSSFFFGLDDGFTPLHALSIITMSSVTLGVWFITRGNRPAHIANMVLSYVGTLIAFGFAAFIPDRLIWQTTVSSPPMVIGFVCAVLLVAYAWLSIIRDRRPATPAVSTAP